MNDRIKSLVYKTRHTVNRELSAVNHAQKTVNRHIGVCLWNVDNLLMLIQKSVFLFIRLSPLKFKTRTTTTVWSKDQRF